MHNICWYLKRDKIRPWSTCAVLLFFYSAEISSKDLNIIATGINFREPEMYQIRNTFVEFIEFLARF